MNRMVLLLISLLITSMSAQITKSAYVANTLGEDLSVINLESGDVLDIDIPLGLFTNQVITFEETAFVVNSGVNEVQVIDLGSLGTVTAFDVGDGTNPFSAAVTDGNLLAVSLLFTNEVAFMDLETGAIEQVVSVGTGPQGMCYADGFVYVANSGFNGYGYDPGVVSAIDMSDYSVSDISVGINPQSVALAPSGDIVVACTGDYYEVTGQVDVIDPLTKEVVQSKSAETAITQVVVTQANKAYLATFGFGVLVYDLAAEQFELDVNTALPGGPGLAIDADNNVYISDFGADSLRVFNPEHAVINAFPVGDGPVSVAIYDPAFLDIGDGEILQPGEFVLNQNYPNPFNPRTAINLNLANRNTVQLAVYDLSGRKIRDLVTGALAAGTHQFKWDGTNALGESVASGIYLYRLTTSDGIAETRKMVLVK